MILEGKLTENSIPETKALNALVPTANGGIDICELNKHNF